MTIVRVYGNINGVGVMPFTSVGDVYYFQPPETLTGKFICEFWAEDEFGNIGYNAAILTLVRGVIKCIEVLTKDYQVTMLSDPMRVGMDMERYDAKMGKIPQTSILDDPYCVHILPITCRRDMMEV